MRFEAINQPTDTRIFPLPLDLVQHYFGQFGGFTEAEVALVTGSNIEMVAPSDPAHSLLQLQEYYGTPTGEQEMTESQAMAYRAGVCIGLAIIRRRMGQLEELGVSVPDLAIEPGSQYLDGMDPHAERILTGWLSYIGLVEEAQREVDHISFGLYIACPQDYRGGSPLHELQAEWANRMSFITPQRLSEPKHIGLGISHTFRLHSELEDQFVG